jgi:hypothetical protein
MDQHYKECKIINDFLAELPEGSHSILETADLERLQKNNQIKFQTKLHVLNEFVSQAKQEC